ncbi:PREDICTED: WD repeat-containing protein 37 [Rhagoletis zephyria]|uniref:WD repeat-containing protein 37 n=1 Tax=Rhagoletis zephyria TaxID=28612 RepID=UPI0008119A32|nr:PREDICTED: WD repeat-containing protein 37 [Rhagoletis zephyria]XP_017486108.1 PREDICTED: WD repeat-containing protein 37 [Rhagoletis zephyria]XP_017486110.1 PREDICTED: WD repeat-containing protein 37 [Rhagoletis zephyria]
MKASKNRLSSLAEDITIPEDAPFRARLHILFGQIEKEFELLYLENLTLQEKLDNCMNKDLIASYERSAGVIAAGGSSANAFGTHASNTGLTSSAQANILTTMGHEDVDTPTLAPIIGGGGGSKGLKAKFTSSSSKVKASNKIKAQTSRIVSSFKAQSVVSQVTREFCGHKDGVWQVTAKVGQPIIGTASADHTACIWSVENGRCLLQYQGHAGSVNSVKFHQNRDLVLTGSGDATAHIWQAAVNWEYSKRGHSSEEELEDSDEQIEDRDRVDTLRTPLCEFTGLGGHSSVVVAADWLPSMDHRQIITGSWDRTAILWDVESREPIQTLTGHDHELTHVSAHSSQRLVVTASRDSTFRLWDFRCGIPAVSVFQGNTESVTSTVFARDDKVVSGSDDRTVKVWELRNMRSALATIRTDSSVNRLAVSSGGIIAIPHDNRQIRLFDLNGQRVARLPRTSRQGHRRMVSSVAWAEEPLLNCDLFSCGFDRRVFGWSIILPKDN